MSSADELKALGNKAIAEKKFDEAMLVAHTNHATPLSGVKLNID